MSRFLAGFVLASLMWAGFLYAYRQGLMNFSLEPEAARKRQENAKTATGAGTPSNRKGRRRLSRPKNGHRRTAASGESVVGDNLGENDTRSIDMTRAGSEAQLTTLQVEQAFDAVFSHVRRCLALAAGDEPVRGKLVFGLRISGQGKVTAVNLMGPNAVTLGDAGACLRAVPSSMRFRAFGGPDMVIHYPITLE